MGFAHPRFKYGHYSKCPLATVAREQHRRERAAAALARDVARASAKREDWTLEESIALIRAVKAQHRRRGWFVK
jgi:hypothetical protein